VIRKEVRGPGRGLPRLILRDAHRFDHHIDPKAGQARVGSEVNQHIKKFVVRLVSGLVATNHLAFHPLPEARDKPWAIKFVRYAVWEVGEEKHVVFVGSQPSPKIVSETSAKRLRDWSKRVQFTVRGALLSLLYSCAS
jgi:hypothetical protein